MRSAGFPQDAVTVVALTDDSLYEKALAWVGVIIAFKWRLVIVQRLPKSTSSPATTLPGVSAERRSWALPQGMGPVIYTWWSSCGWVAMGGRAIHEGAVTYYVMRAPVKSIETVVTSQDQRGWT